MGADDADVELDEPRRDREHRLGVGSRTATQPGPLSTHCGVDDLAAVDAEDRRDALDDRLLDRRPSAAAAARRTPARARVAHRDRVRPRTPARPRRRAAARRPTPARRGRCRASGDRRTGSSDIGREDAHAVVGLGSLGGRTNVVSDRFVQCANRCICSSLSPSPSSTTATGLPR